MQDFDRDNEPSLADIANNRKVKLTALVILGIATIIAAVLDTMGLVGKW